MGLETGTYIDSLVSTNPLGTDAKSAGDDHIRLLKSTIKATFPNIAGAVTPTHTELNFVDGVTSAIQTQLDSKQASGSFQTADPQLTTLAGMTAGAATGLASLVNWTVEETAGVLYFKTGGVSKAKLDASGNLTVVGNITAYGTM